MVYASRPPCKRSKGLSILEEWLLGKRQPDLRDGTLLPPPLGTEAHVYRCNRLCCMAVG